MYIHFFLFETSLYYRVWHSRLPSILFVIMMTNKTLLGHLVSYTFDKGYYVFYPITRFVCVYVCLCVRACVCVCVCVCVITFVMRWLDLATWCHGRSILSTRTWKCNTSQDDPSPFLFPFHMDHPYKITFGL